MFTSQSRCRNSSPVKNVCSCAPTYYLVMDLFASSLASFTSYFQVKKMERDTMKNLFVEFVCQGGAYVMLISAWDGIRFSSWCMLWKKERIQRISVFLERWVKTLRSYVFISHAGLSRSSTFDNSATCYTPSFDYKYAIIMHIKWSLYISECYYYT